MRDESGWAGLMSRVQDGDAVAYRQLLTELLPAVRARVRTRRIAPNEAEDVVQEVLLSMHRVRGSYDPGRPFWPWLDAIIGARVIDHVRKVKRRAQHEISDGQIHETVTIDEHTTDAADDLAVLPGLIGALPGMQKIALELLTIKEIPLKDAARQTGQSIGALKVALCRARRNLRTMLEAKHGLIR